MLITSSKQDISDPNQQQSGAGWFSEDVTHVAAFFLFFVISRIVVTRLRILQANCSQPDWLVLQPLPMSHLREIPQGIRSDTNVRNHPSMSIRSKFILLYSIPHPLLLPSFPKNNDRTYAWNISFNVACFFNYLNRTSTRISKHPSKIPCPTCSKTTVTTDLRSLSAKKKKSTSFNNTPCRLSSRRDSLFA